MPNIRILRSRAAVVAAAGWLLACAGRHEDTGVDPQVAVPDASARVEADVGEGDWADQLRSQAVCLIRTGNAAGCRGEDEADEVCDPRSEAEVSASLDSLFQALPRITLKSPFSVPQDVKAFLPGAVVTRAVDDARRSRSCLLWEEGSPPCVGVRTAGVWAVLYRNDPAPGPVQHVEILLAGDPCPSNINE